MRNANIPYTVRVTAVFVLNLLIAVFAPPLAESVFRPLHIHFSRSFGTAMLQEDLISSVIAFGLGFSVYRLWRPEASKWLWPAGICWFVPRALLTLHWDSDSAFGGPSREILPDYQTLVNWGGFTLPCLRTLFYSAGALCCSRWWNRTARKPAGAAMPASTINRVNAVARMRGRRHGGVDSRIEIVVDPNFEGSILALANSRCLWIVDTPGNQTAIDIAWRAGEKLDLCETSRCEVENPDSRQENLPMIMGVLDDHYLSYDTIVHGVEPDATVERLFNEEEGFEITEQTPDGFVAVRIPGVRERPIGRAAEAGEDTRQ